MANPTKVLLQTTIPFTEDDWHIGRFSLLHDYLAAYCSDLKDRAVIYARKHSAGHVVGGA